MSFAGNRVAKGYARLGRIVKITGMIGRGRTLPDRLPDSRRKNHPHLPSSTRCLGYRRTPQTHS